MWSGKPAHRRLLRLACSGSLMVAAQPVWAQGAGGGGDVGVGVAPAATSTISPPVREGIVIRVRLVTSTQLTAPQMAWLSREVDRVWAPYGVRLHWTEGAPQAMAGEPPHLVLVMLGSSECPVDVPRGALAALHTAPIDDDRAAGGRPAAVIMVSLDRAWRLATRAFGNEQTVFSRATRVRARLPVLIGRAVAHEIGHYLLESREHANHGLMRAAYGPDDAKDALDYSLDAAQISRIRLRWAQRQVSGRLAASR